MSYDATPPRGPHRRQDSAMSSSSYRYDDDPYNNNRTGFPPAPVNFEDDHYNDTEPMATPRPKFAATPADQRVSFAPPKSTGDLRIWRHDERGNMWTKGGRTKCFGRFCCCTIMMTLFFIISIVLALALWARPPDIRFNGIQLPTSGSGVTVEADGLHINLQLSIGVKNPNFFGAAFSSIEAKAFYPPLTTQLGGGILNDINFKANSDTSFLFPFNIVYTTASDPTNILIKDLVDKCGIRAGTTKKKLTVEYELELALRIIAVTIHPSFSGSADFDCPVTRDDLVKLGGEDILKSLGVE